MVSEQFFERLSQLSPKRLTLLAIELQSKLEALEQQAAEPIAIIGMGCRFPGGADSPEAFWELLRQGVDAITEVPASRWPIDQYYDPNPDAPGKVSTRWGGFIDAIDQFDPQVFGIAPREALSMDPQQRLLLEVAWEALEWAGYAPDRLEGSPVGVFVGLCNSDYFQLLATEDNQNIDAYLATGNAGSVASGRISYLLGLQGPSLTVDTACSSSLVAVHLAVQSLRQGECRMALTGGVNAILSPRTTITLSKAKMMAPDGRCKTFDAAANGFVRAEGCGLVVLKRLSDAIADGDTVLAVIRGSAVNQDGRSNGLTAPNGPSQESVLRQALANAGVGPEDMFYVEAHGTGTSLGDPIEIQALGAVLGEGRVPDRPLLVGSVKTNIGHLESAAGIAGLIKLVLAIQHREIPPHLHLQSLNSYIPWERWPIQIPTQATPWGAGEGRFLGGVSSFGFSGTNAHVILEAAPAPLPPQPASLQPRSRHLLTLSAKTREALMALAERYKTFLDAHPEVDLGDVCFTANTGRAQFSHRLSLMATSVSDLREKLSAAIGGEEMPGVMEGEVAGTHPPKLAFLFTGQGCQYPGMGRELYDSQPVFREALERCATLLQPYLERPLLEVLYGAETPLLDQTAYTQPALFALEYALAQMWQSWDVQPSIVMGHSVGEYVAACVAGVFSLEDGLKLIAARGRLMQALPPNGAMIAIMADEATIEPLLQAHPQVAIAAHNGPLNLVLSGPRQGIQTVTPLLEAQGIKVTPLKVSHAFHSPLMEPMLQEFGQIAATVAFQSPQIDLVSNLTGQVATAEVATPQYWVRHVRQAVRFAEGMETLRQQGYSLLIELGPKPVLLGMGRLCWPAGTGTWLPSLHPQLGDWEQLLHSLATLYNQGLEMNWARVDQDMGRRRLVLPTYPFQRQRYWIDPVAPAPPLPPLAGHPLLGQRLRSPALQDPVFQSSLSVQRPAFLDHHRIYGVPILPSPAYLEMAIAAALEAWGKAPASLTNFTIQEALILPEQGGLPVQTLLTPIGPDQAQFQVVSLTTGSDWKVHATGILHLQAEPGSQTIDLPTIQARCADQWDGQAYYEKLYELGLEFQSSFRGIRHLWRRDGEALGEMVLPPELQAETGSYRIHPAFLDACLHLLGAPLSRDLDTTYLLIGLDRLCLYQAPANQLWTHVVLQESEVTDQETFTGNMRLFNPEGNLVATLEGIHLKRADRATLMRAIQARPKDWLYQVEWQLQPDSDWQVSQPPDYLPTPDRLRQQLAPQVHQEYEQAELLAYGQLSPELDRLSAAYIGQALHQLGWTFSIGERVTADGLADQLGIVPAHRRLFSRLLEMLAEDGYLQVVEQGWQVVQRPEPIDLATQWQHLRYTYPAYDAELNLLGQCGPALGEVLQGTCDPLQLLFPNGSLAATEPLYQDSPFARAFNGLVQQTIATALANLPADRPLRVLEVGAGTGATTSYILSQLPVDRSTYVFTDLSPLFLDRARAKFRDYGFVQYQVLDIEQDPLQQELVGQSFDLVVAANVLHATTDLGQTMTHVRQLLAPNGLLVLLEGTEPQRWVDLTFGLTEGWWRFTDRTLRPHYPLISQAQWLELLQSLGFAATVVSSSATDGGAGNQTLILAQAPTRIPVSDRPTWLILCDQRGVGQALAEQLTQAGERCQLLSQGPTLVQQSPDRWQVDPTSEAFPALLQELLTLPTAAYRGVVHLWSLDIPRLDVLTLADLEASQQMGSGSALQVIQSLARIQNAAPLWLVTRAAQPVAGTTDLAVAQSPLWGLGRVIALEHPDRWGGLIDLEATASPQTAAHQILKSIRGRDGEDQIGWRNDRRYLARLVRRPVPLAQPIAWQAEGSYLITGGLGGLGLKVAHWMAQQGAGHLVLTGRQGLPDRTTWATIPPDSPNAAQIRALQAIEALGTTVTVVAVDVGDEAQMTALFQQFGQTCPPLRGVVHAAAAMSFWTLQEMPLTALEEMFRAKVIGTWLLHQLTQNLDLDFLLLFSSTTALLGASHLGHYAAANQFLDGLAHYRQSIGLPALSVNWGTWDEMRVASSQDQQRVAQFGLQQMASEQALGLLTDMLGDRQICQLTMAAIDWTTLKAAYEARRQRPFLQQIHLETPKKPAPVRTQVAAGPELVEKLASCRPGDRREVLVAYLQATVARVLGISPPTAIGVQQGLFEMGLDSLMSVELKGKLGAAIGQSLPSTLIFNYPTIQDLAGYFETDVLQPDSEVSRVTAAAGGGNTVSLQSLMEPQASGEPDLEEEDLSEDELAALLSEKLGQLESQSR
ncbi:hypothetical protein BST81_00805 [Leptolyngbya sp. 'hensonii']|uniref:type I polyketide synthase n=1 Tax=Leptolyngbya sp. 'hensonii' TaxID=1922337 RepID=UPI0009500FD8|nr:type I polyketide synthase [Leptolyngbya sp. 'hensonii']OLP20310.1 hypothetical protein BST81_00805 [Leptolyngbya sp. 'hensonii']